MSVWHQTASLDASVNWIDLPTGTKAGGKDADSEDGHRASGEPAQAAGHTGELET